MAKQTEQDKARTAVERDVDYLTKHPSEAEIIMAGALASGAKKGVEHVIETTEAFVQKMFEPGDMNLANSPHPIDAVGSGVNKLSQPGDMNLAHSPHPVDAISQLADSTQQKVTEAGVFGGAELVSAIGVAAVIESVDPFKKGELIVDGVSAVGHLGADVKHIAGYAPDRTIMGELVDEVSHQKNIAVSLEKPAIDGPIKGESHPSYYTPQDIVLPEALQKTADMVLNIFKHKEIPLPDRFVNMAANAERGSFQKMLDRSDSKVDHELDSWQERVMPIRAEALSKYLKDNPEINQKLTESGVSKQQVYDILHLDALDAHLGIAPFKRQHDGRQVASSETLTSNQIASNQAKEASLEAGQSFNPLAIITDKNANMPARPNTNPEYARPEYLVPLEKVEADRAAAQKALHEAKYGTDDMGLFQRGVHIFANNVRGRIGLGYDLGKAQLAELKAAAEQSDMAALAYLTKKAYVQTVGVLGATAALGYICLHDNEQVKIHDARKERYREQADTFEKKAMAQDPAGSAPALERYVASLPDDERKSWDVVVSNFRNAQLNLRTCANDGKAFDAASEKLVQQFTAIIDDKGIDHLAQRISSQTSQQQANQEASLCRS